jgi:hypothetical protein
MALEKNTNQKYITLYDNKSPFASSESYKALSKYKFYYDNTNIDYLEKAGLIINEALSLFKQEWRSSKYIATNTYKLPLLQVGASLATLSAYTTSEMMNKKDSIPTGTERYENIVMKLFWFSMFNAKKYKNSTSETIAFSQVKKTMQCFDFYLGSGLGFDSLDEGAFFIAMQNYRSSFVAELVSVLETIYQEAKLYYDDYLTFFSGTDPLKVNIILQKYAFFYDTTKEDFNDKIVLQRQISILKIT